MEIFKKKEDELDLKELYKQIEEAYNTSAVAEHFVIINNYQEIEEIAILRR